MCAKRITFDGDRDTNEARTMLDKVDGNGFRTVKTSLPDAEIMLRTRGGNPELTVEKKQPPAELSIDEIDFEKREYYTTNQAQLIPTNVLSTIVSFIKVIATRSGKMRFKTPPEKGETAKTAKFYAPHRSYSSDGIYSIDLQSPRSAAVRSGTASFQEIAYLAGNTPPANLSDKVDGKLRRKFYKARLMRNGSLDRSTMLFLINPIKQLVCSLNGKPARMRFKEPVVSSTSYTSRAGSTYGLLSLKNCYFDHIRVWGQPYHGKMTNAGVFTTESGTILSGAPVTGTQCQLVKFSSTPVEYLSGEEIDSTLAGLGVSWKNYAILVGDLRRYDPLEGPSAMDPSHNATFFGANTWLYRTASGTTWCLRLLRSGSDAQGKIIAWKTEDHFISSPTVHVVRTDIPDVDDALKTATAAFRTQMSSSADGTKAVFIMAYGQETTVTAPFVYAFEALNGTYIGSPSDLNVNPSCKYVVFTTSGGDDSTPPTVTFESFSRSNDPACLYTDPAYTRFSAGTFVAHYKIVLGVWVEPVSGDLIKLVKDMQVTRQYIAGKEVGYNAVEYPLMPGYEAITKFNAVRGGAVNTLMQKTRTVTRTYSPTSTPGIFTNDSVSDTGEGLTINLACNDFSVSQVHSAGWTAASTAKRYAIGALGTVLEIDLSDSYYYGQHPITGELAQRAVFF